MAAREWHLTEIGSGAVGQCAGQLQLSLSAADGDAYHDAQISDYASRADFRHEPPLRLSLSARANGQLHGTAGFGFWNQAFMPGQRSFRLPQALWFFFASPPSDMALAMGVPGRGWKAASFDARNWRFLGLLPLAPLGFVLMRRAWLYERLWGIGQRAIGVHERLLSPDLLRDWHRYTIEWRRDGADFAVDGELVLRAGHAPRGRLGFIAWIDNQYAIVTPQGRFGWGLLDLPGPQSLQLRDIQISAMS